MRAEAAGDPGPWRQQALLGRDQWDADGLRDMVRDYVTEHLADENTVLVIDGTRFLEQGKASCGVARQYTGSAGEITNCRDAVCLLPTCRVTAMLSSIEALCLPKGWTDDPARLKAAVCAGQRQLFDQAFSLRYEMIKSAPLRLACRSVCECWPIASMGSAISNGTYRQAGKGYVLGVNSNHWFAVMGQAATGCRHRRGDRQDAATIGLAASIGRRRGTKGPRLHDWCYLELADLEGENSNHHSQVLWTRGLLIRRNIANGDLAYFTTWCPAGTSIKTLVSVEGHRWAIEDSFETAKNDVRARPRRIQIVAWLASSRLARHARICHDGCHPTSGQQAGAQKNQVGRDAKTSTSVRWSIQEIRRIAQRLAQKRIQPADVVGMRSLWRRAHQAAAQKSHIKQKSQL